MPLASLLFECVATTHKADEVGQHAGEDVVVVMRAYYWTTLIKLCGRSHCCACIIHHPKKSDRCPQLPNWR